MPDTIILDTDLDVVQRTFPIALSRFDPAAKPTGLVIVDEVNGFCTVGCGPLAPASPNEQVSRMVAETVALARRFEAAEWPILAFLDTHIPGKAEPPYPPHCEIGTGQENLVAELEWLGAAQHATLIRKDCINGFIGAIQPERHQPPAGLDHRQRAEIRAGRRDLHRYLRDGFRADAAVGAQPRHGG